MKFCKEPVDHGDPCVLQGYKKITRVGKEGVESEIESIDLC